MSLFQKKCEHDWKVTHVSNISQPDRNGYLTRLCICKCEKCGETTQQWRDCPLMIKNLPTFENVVEIEWKEIVTRKSTVTVDTPVNCRECRFSRDEADRDDRYCIVARKRCEYGGIKRPDWCPLEPVEEPNAGDIKPD